MGWPQQLGGVVIDGATKAVGRRLVVRTARFALNRARLDIPNGIETNGEAMLQAHVVSAMRGAPFRVFDVGANRGEWSLSMLSAAAATGVSGDLELHAFEASEYTAGELRRTLDGCDVQVNHVGLSDRSGTGRLHVVGPGAGTNSLSELPAPGAEIEVITLTTVDDYCEAHSIDSVDFLKIDTEGHDLMVMLGAQRMLDRHAIRFVQFEYNQRWIPQRRFLRDAFDLLEPRGYILGKLTPRGVEEYPQGWDWELESFVEGNYLARRANEAVSPPTLRWWKQT